MVEGCVLRYVYSRMCTQVCVLRYVYSGMCTQVCVLRYVYMVEGCVHRYVYSGMCTQVCILRYVYVVEGCVCCTRDICSIICALKQIDTAHLCCYLQHSAGSRVLCSHSTKFQ